MIRKFCCWMNPSPMWMSTLQARWFGCWQRHATDGKTIFIVTHQASLLEGVADEFIWMTAGKIAGRTTDLTPPPEVA